MLAALLKRLEEMRDKPGETYPLDAVERELILEALEVLAKRTLMADGPAEKVGELRDRLRVWLTCHKFGHSYLPLSRTTTSGALAVR